ncbi:MAG TPA: AMP-binding protein, partial [Polymorphobacter sp.]|nr:AMP-binding protein [Polymorphobacter sp.]
MLVSDIPIHAAHHNPHGIAVQFHDRSMTYAALRDDCWRLANALLEFAEAGDRVAILAENCPEYALCYYGVPAAGMALTLLNYRLAPGELAYIIGDAAPTVLVVEDKFLGRIESIRDLIPSVRTVVVIGAGAPAPHVIAFDALLARGRPQPPARAVAEDALAWLLYTSGTTGLPKGVMLSHRNVMAAVLNSLVSWDRQADDTVMMMTFPMYHVAGYGMLIS